MPVRKPIFPYLSYITADGDEVILSCEGYKKWWECYGRSGFFAPKLNYVERQYADGATDVLAISLKPRKLTIEMFVLGQSTKERDEILRNISSRLIQVGSRNQWGRLRVRRSDGKDLYIDCVYIGGMDDAVEKYPNIMQFELQFYSGGSYFYDKDETILATQSLGDVIYLSDDLYLSDNLYLSDGVSGITVNNSGEMFYPIVDVFGPASVIRITNNTTGITLAVDSDFVLLAGQKLTFDCLDHERKVEFTDVLGNTTDVTKRLALGASLVWPIEKGANSLTFYYTDTNEDTFARIRYRQRYFSI